MASDMGLSRSLSMSFMAMQKYWCREKVVCPAVATCVSSLVHRRQVSTNLCKTTRSLGVSQSLPQRLKKVMVEGSPVLPEIRADSLGLLRIACTQLCFGQRDRLLPVSHRDFHPGFPLRAMFFTSRDTGTFGDPF